MIKLTTYAFVTALTASLAGGALAADAPLHYVDSVAQAGAGRVVVDARPAEACEEASLAGARCLPARDFLGLHGRLAGFANIAWVLGSAGLTGAEEVLVVGTAPAPRDFVAGLLYIMGQKDVAVLTRNVKDLPGAGEGGEPRGMLRTAIWQAPARDEALIFINELQDLLKAGKPLLLDGRGEQAYWGREVTAARGGHLPGADHLPASELRAGAGAAKSLLPQGAEPIVYGRGAVDGIAYFTLVMAGAGVKARVFPGGWARWAANGALPADAETHPPRRRPAAAPAAGASEGAAGAQFSSFEMAAGAAAGLLLGGVLALVGASAVRRRKEA